jgi:hypothetical protein
MRLSSSLILFAFILIPSALLAGPTFQISAISTVGRWKQIAQEQQEIGTATIWFPQAITCGGNSVNSIFVHIFVHLGVMQVGSEYHANYMMLVNAALKDLSVEITNTSSTYFNYNSSKSRCELRLDLDSHPLAVLY